MIVERFIDILMKTQQTKSDELNPLSAKSPSNELAQKTNHLLDDQSDLLTAVDSLPVLYQGNFRDTYCP